MRLVKRIFALVMVLACLTLAACSNRETPNSSEPVPVQPESTPSSVAASEESVSVSSESEDAQADDENTETAVFAVGADLQDEKTMQVGDTIGEWTLADLKIQYHDEKIARVNALFEGNVTMKGTISRNVFVDYSFDFMASKEDTAKIPHYIDSEMDYGDRFMFMLNFSDALDETVKLEHGEEMDCEITISDYRFIFAYMMAPDNATVVDIKFN